MFNEVIFGKAAKVKRGIAKVSRCREQRRLRCFIGSVSLINLHTHHSHTLNTQTVKVHKCLLQISANVKRIQNKNLIWK